jgi:GNAT superfamily N-acetyltransferase
MSAMNDLRLIEEDFDGPGAAALLPGYVTDIRALYPEWTPDVPPHLTAQNVKPPAGRWLVAYRGETPVACAGLKRLDDRTAEIKRLYVAAPARGTGIARALIERLEEAASLVGYQTLRLDTGPRQQASVALFRSCGYHPIDDYNGNPVAAYWFEKQLS